MMQTDMSSVPIDIHANRLLEWLVTRHHCNKDWPDKVESVRSKINEAIKDMPEDATIAKLLINANPINYYHCVKIVEVLKETEADTKNIFGMYGSSRMKDWQDILKSYQRDSLYLAESASILARNVIYEIPALKRHLTKLEQTQQESSKREGQCKKQAQDYRDKFVSSCNHLGLQFDAPTKDYKSPSVAAVAKQLTTQMSQELPEVFDKIAAKAKDLKTAVTYYRNFLHETIQFSDEDEAECLGLLNLVIDKGNVTTYEWIHKEAPLTVEPPPSVDYTFEEDQDEDADAGGEINFGDVDFSTDDVQLETGDIDWGGIETAEDDGAQIDFSLDDVDTAGIVVEQGGIEGGVARNEEALSILENVASRDQFINELVELEGFLLQRIDEVKSLKPNELTLTSVDDSLSVEEMSDVLKKVVQVINMFNENKTKQFLLVRESKRYVVRIAENLLHNLKLAKKLDAQEEQEQTRFAECSKEQEQVRPKIQSLLKQSRELQSQLAKEISAKYNGRPVYITGGGL